MRLGIPVVVTPDPALLEVTGGLATVMDGWDAPALARAVPQARQTSQQELEAGVEHAATFTWRRTATDVRAALVAQHRVGTRAAAAGEDDERHPHGRGQVAFELRHPATEAGPGLAVLLEPRPAGQGQSKSPSKRRARSWRVFIL